MIDVEHGNLVKICGLRSEPAARTAALAGADALGFILAESRRQVDPSRVREIGDAVSMDLERPPAAIGVTVNATPYELESWFATAGLDYVQLSGDESPTILDDLDLPIIKTIHVTADMSVDALEAEIDRWFDHRNPVVAVHIDTKVEGVYGGSGVQSDWSVAASIAERYPSILAGGLKPGNVIEGIHAVRPRGVDVSSGVEIAGEKDLALIEAFVVHARQGFSSHAEDQGMF